MSIESYIASLCLQKAVYWGAPTNDGYGQFTFSPGIEIDCRWENKEQIVAQEMEKAVIFRSIIYVLQDLDTDGLLWLGTADAVGVAAIANPYTMTAGGLMIVKRFEKTPSIRDVDQFLRKAFLSPYMY